MQITHSDALANTNSLLELLEVIIVTGISSYSDSLAEAEGGGEAGKLCSSRLGWQVGKTSAPIGKINRLNIVFIKFMWQIGAMEVLLSFIFFGNYAWLTNQLTNQQTDMRAHRMSYN